MLRSILVVLATAMCVIMASALVEHPLVVALLALVMVVVVLILAHALPLAWYYFMQAIRDSDDERQ